MTTTGTTTDVELWRRVCDGSREAFEEVVRRHQGVVTAVAYNACGDLAASEDVAQEAFWVAWRKPDSLDDPTRLRPWICGIARNLGANAARKAASKASPTSLAEIDVAGDDEDPAGATLEREEQALIWRSLEDLPDSYREPLILFYRQDQSVAEVAATLELSEDAVKQRLSRGRAMLRDRLAGVVEDGLRRSRPGRRFTAGVMAGLGFGLGGKPAAAGVIGAAAPATVSAGLLGGLLGSVVGLAGGWLGTWLPAQAASTVRERELILRSGRSMLVGSIAFIGAIFLLVRIGAGTRWYLPALLLLMVTFQASLFLVIWRMKRKLRAAKEEAGPEEPNRTGVRRRMAKVVNNVQARSYRSPRALLGLPLLDVQVADPPAFDADGVEIRQAADKRTARGWIAVGDDARGVLLAVGGRAVGGVAIGGRSAGIVAFGGVALGVASFGGISLGMVSIGGLAVGVMALGGGALGWVAMGGLAVGMYAGGGAALSWKLAIGGLAVSRELAMGGASIGPQPVDPAAGFRWLRGGPAPIAALDGMIPTLLRRLLNGGQLPWIALAIAGVLVEAARTASMYRRRRP